MRIRLLLLFCLLDINNIVYAEGGCPPGTYPANLPATNICNPFPGNENNGQPQQPQGRWETRWGAIAIGSTASGGGVGLVRINKSQRIAEKEAFSQCMATGGHKLSPGFYHSLKPYRVLPVH